MNLLRNSDGALTKTYEEMAKTWITNFKKFMTTWGEDVRKLKLKKYKPVNFDYTVNNTKNTSKANIAKKIVKAKSEKILDVLKSGQLIRNKLKLQDIDPVRAVVIEKYAGRYSINNL